MNTSILFITGNPGKAAEVSKYIGLPVDHMKMELEEIQSLDLKEIVKLKAEQAYAAVKRPVLVEDVSFTFDCLGGKLPGPFIKWFVEEIGNEGLCKLADGKEKGCVATVTYGFHDGNDIHFFEGSMKGSVSDAPRGTRSFGWAACFVPEGMSKTYAELTDEEQAAISMRKMALTKLRAALSSKHTP